MWWSQIVFMRLQQEIGEEWFSATTVEEHLHAIEILHLEGRPRGIWLRPMFTTLGAPNGVRVYTLPIDHIAVMNRVDTAHSLSKSRRQPSCSS